MAKIWNITCLAMYSSASSISYFTVLHFAAVISTRAAAWSAFIPCFTKCSCQWWYEQMNEWLIIHISIICFKWFDLFKHEHKHDLFVGCDSNVMVIIFFHMFYWWQNLYYKVILFLLSIMLICTILQTLIQFTYVDTRRREDHRSVCSMSLSLGSLKPVLSCSM